MGDGEQNKSVNYPRLAQLGVLVHEHEGYDYVDREELEDKLKDRRDQFRTLFGIQTCPMEGLFAGDAEAVLERMLSGRRIGIQLEWD